MSSSSDDAYRAAGVDYDQLDAFKRACQRAAGPTRDQLEAHGLTEPAGVRGESAYLLESADGYLAHVEEGLGTKNLVADAMANLTGECFYESIGVDTVATIVNDLVTCGASPVSVAMHAAVGDSNWFADTGRAEALARGFARGCVEAGAVWGGGETPTLRGIVEPGTIVLAGSAVGVLAPKSLRITGDIRDGDAIIFLGSSGVQTNGLTLCRKLADQLPQGYLTKLPDGRAYGAALLDASVIYVRFVRACQREGVTLNYVAHVTGHGWRKLMRLDEPFVYEITRIIGEQPMPAVFDFLARHAALDDRQAYGTFNMGVGFAVYVRTEAAERVVELARAEGYDAWVAGAVKKEGDRKAVRIPRMRIEYDGATLALR